MLGHWIQLAPLLLPLLLITVLPAGTQSQEAGVRALPTLLDLHIAVDSSASITDQQYADIKQTLVTFLSSLPIKRDEVWVSVRPYSMRVNPVIEWTWNTTALFTAIPDLPRIEGDTRTDLAIADAMHNLIINGRHGAAKAMVIITDGVTRLPHKMDLRRQEAETLGIGVYAVAFGQRQNLQGLLRIAGTYNGIYSAASFVSDLPTDLMSFVRIRVTTSPAISTTPFNETPFFDTTAKLDRTTQGSGGITTTAQAGVITSPPANVTTAGSVNNTAPGLVTASNSANVATTASGGVTAGAEGVTTAAPAGVISTAAAGGVPATDPGGVNNTASVGATTTDASGAVTATASGGVPATAPGGVTTTVPGGVVTNAAFGDVASIVPGGVNSSTIGGVSISPGVTTTAPGGVTTAPGVLTETTQRDVTTTAPGGMTPIAPGGATNTVTTSSPGRATAAPGGVNTNAPGGVNTNAPEGVNNTAPGGVNTNSPGGVNTNAPGGVNTNASSGVNTTAPGGMTTVLVRVPTTAPGGGRDAANITTSRPFQTTTQPFGQAVGDTTMDKIGTGSDVTTSSTSGSGDDVTITTSLPPMPDDGGTTNEYNRHETGSWITKPENESSSAGICGRSDVVVAGGIGYLRHPSACDRYIQCYPEPAGTLVAVTRQCPVGMYWDERIGMCDKATSVVCPTEMCRSPSVRDYQMAGNCRSFWRCQDGRSEPACCDRGHAYFPGRGCAPCSRCTDACPEKCLTKRICNKRPDWESPSAYQLDMGLLGWMTTYCDDGSTFDVTSCSCSSTPFSLSFCRSPILRLAFDGTDAQHDGIQTQNLLRLSGSAVFSGNSSLTALFSPGQDASRSSERQLSLRLRYKESLPFSQEAALLRSSPCGSGDMLFVYADQTTMNVKVFTPDGQVAQTTLLTEGFEAAVWKSLELTYSPSTSELAVSASSGFLKYSASTRVPVRVSLSECGWTFGHPKDNTNLSPFEGRMDDIQINSC